MNEQEKLKSQIEVLQLLSDSYQNIYAGSLERPVMKSAISLSDLIDLRNEKRRKLFIEKELLKNIT